MAQIADPKPPEENQMKLTRTLGAFLALVILFGLIAVIPVTPVSTADVNLLLQIRHTRTPAAQMT